MDRKEAIEVVKKNWPHSGYTMLREALETLIPELAESEDEKIRKDLIRWVNTNISYDRMPDGMNYSNECVLAWLEKQGEQKPSWSEDDEIGYNDVLFAIEKARLVAKDENDMGNLWFAENWLKSLKRSRVVKIEKQDDGKPKDNSVSEFKESKDERIRKALMQNLKERFGIKGNMGKGLDMPDVLDWLEKQGERKMPAMIQWKGDNLKAVIDFTGVYKEGFEKWFHNSWEEFEKYVHEHKNIFKIFNEDGSHIEVPVGAWIVKTPDGYNIASRYVFRQKANEWSKDDERLRKTTIGFLKDFAKQGYENAVECIDWLEKQGEQKRLGYPYVTGWRENRPDNKPQIKHSVLMLTTHGVVEGEWLSDGWYQYRWACKVKDTDVLYWLHLSDLESLEKEGNNNSISSEEIGKSIIRGIAGSLTNYLDNNRYAGAMNMSNMECEDLEKAILGSNWEKVYRYMQKKLEKQGEQKSYWSEEDENLFNNLVYLIEKSNEGKATQKGFITFITKLKSLLKSFKPHWKPREEQLRVLQAHLKQGAVVWGDNAKVLKTLYEDLQKLLKE